MADDFEHDDENMDCPCRPILMIPCPLCDPDQKDRASCRRCNDSGIVSATREQADEADEVYIMHVSLDSEAVN